jgi:hypothetical protein
MTPDERLAQAIRDAADRITTPEVDIDVVRRKARDNRARRVALTVMVALVLAFVANSFFLGGGPVSAPSPADRPTDETSDEGQTGDGPIDTTDWPMYESERYGFSIGHPPGWTVTTADRDWTLAADGADWLSPAQERFTSPDEEIRVSAWSVPTDTAETLEGVEDWIGTYCEEATTPCFDIPERAQQLCNEGLNCHPGLLVTFKEEVNAFFTGGDYGGQMVVVVVWRPSDLADEYGGPQRLLEGFLATMDVCTLPNRDQCLPADLETSP